MRTRRWKLPRGLSILHEDADILVVVKPSGLLTMGTDAEKSQTAHFTLTEYVRGERRDSATVSSSCIGSTRKPRRSGLRQERGGQALLVGPLR